MSPDDPRHGSVAGHAAGCRDDCCDRAKLRYDKRRKLAVVQGQPFTVPALGIGRRVRALQALGYSMPDIAEAAGVSWRTIYNACHRVDTVYRATAEAVMRAYEQLSMTVPEGGYAVRNRNLAKRNGWAVPLAWDDIDTDPAPATGSNHRRRTDVDHAVVERVLAGEVLATTKAEKDEIVRRWIARGRSLAELERQLGIKAERYGREDVA